jgi:hypothetical protein
VREALDVGHEGFGVKGLVAVQRGAEEGLPILKITCLDVNVKFLVTYFVECHIPADGPEFISISEFTLISYRKVCIRLEGF